MKTRSVKNWMHVVTAGLTSLLLALGAALPVYAAPAQQGLAQAVLAETVSGEPLTTAADEQIDNGYDFTFFVNDLRTRADASPGDGICATADVLEDGAPACTLYAAIQEANATADGQSVLIVPADSMRAYNGTWSANGLINVIIADEAGSAPDMLPTWTAMQAVTKQRTYVDGDTTSRYHVAHDDVTLDFQNRLGFTMNRDAGSSAMFVFSGANQTLRNMSELTSCEGGIYIGATAQNTLIENSFLGNPPVTTQAGYALERAVQIVEGASNTTLRNLSFSRNYHNAVGLVAAADANARLTNLVIEGSDFYWTNNGGGHDHAWSLALFTWHNDVQVEGMEFRGNTIRDWGIDGGVTDTIQLDGTGNTNAPQWKDVRFYGNTFNRNYAAANQNHIQTYNLTAQNFVIEGNTFINRAYTAQTSYGNSDIYINLSDGFTIRDNHFDSLNGSSIITTHARAVADKNETYRNTFTNVGGRMSADVENSTTNTAATILRWQGNNNIRTAYATGAKVIDDPVNSCRIDVTLAPPTTTGGNAIGSDEVYVDVFIGSEADKGAETYLGRVKTTITELNANPVKSFSYTGAGEGNYVRIQTTEISTGFTSNYSRGVAATGQDTCAPWSWTKEKGWFNSQGELMSSQQDPTSDRLVKFEILTSEALEEGSLVAADIEFIGNAYQPSVVSIEQLSSTKWELTAQANGSGTITPRIKIGAITDLAGNANIDVSNHHPGPINFSGYLDSDQIESIPGADIDTTVRYISPLRLTNKAVEVSEPSTTDAIGIEYATHLLVGGRLTKAPQYPVNFVANWGTLVPDASVPAITPAQTAQEVVELSGVLTSEVTSGQAVASPINNFVHDGTRTTTFDLIAQSQDPEFDGLVLNAPESGGPLEKLDATILDDDAPDGAKSSLSVRTNNALADGVAKNIVVATVRNSAGELVSNALVTFELPPGVDLVTAGGKTDGTTATLVTNAQGQATAELTSLIGGQAFDIAALLTGDEIAGSPVQVTFISLPASAQDSHYSVSTGPKVADGTESHTITVLLATETGAPAPGFASALAASASPLDGVTIGAFTESEVPGTYTAPITSTVVGTSVISVTINSNGITTVDPVGENTAEFVSSGPSLDDSLLTISTGSKIADGEDSHVLTATLTDEYGNAVAHYADQLTVIDASGNIVATEFSETAPGVYQASVSTSVAGSYPLTVKVGEVGSLGPVEGLFVAGVVDAGTSTLTVTDSPRSVDDIDTAPHSAQVKVTDAFGNPVSGVSVLFSTSPFLTPALAQSEMTVVSGSDGIARLSLPSQKATTYTVSATISGNAVKQSPAQITYTPGEVVFTSMTPALSATSGTVPADGSATHTVTATVLDQFDNPVAGADIEFVLPPALTTVSVTGSQTNAEGIVELVVSSVTEGDFTVTALVNDTAIPVDATVSFWNNGPNAQNSTITVTSQTRLADGVDFHLVTVTLMDSQDQGVTGQTDGFELSNDSLIFGAITEVDPVNQPGVYTVQITSQNSGEFEVDAHIGTAEIGGSPVVVEFVPGPPSTAEGNTSLTATTGTRLADGIATHSVTLTVRDAFGNPIVGAAATLSYDADSLSTTAEGANASTGTVSVVTDEQGTATVDFTSIKAGGFDVSATVAIGDLDLDPVTLAFVAGAPSTAESVLSITPTPPSDVVADGNDSYTASVLVRDSFGNPVPNRTVTFTGGSLGLSSTTAITDASGNATITVTSTKSGQFPLKAAINAGEVTASPASLTFIAGAPSFGAGTTRIDATGGSVPADGASTHTVTVRVLDALKNPVAGTEVSFALPGEVTGDATATSDENGLATITVTSTAAGTFNVTATIDSTAVSNGSPASVTFGAGAFDPSKSSFVLETTGTKIADGVDAHVVKLIARDASGNLVSGASVSVSLVDPNGGAALSSATLTSDSSGEATTTVTATIAGGHEVQAMAGQTRLRALATQTQVPGSPVIAQFVAGAGTAAQSTLSVTPQTPVTANSVDEFTVTALIRDANGNPVGAGTTVEFTVPGSVDASDSTAVTDAEGKASITITSAVIGTFDVKAALGGEEIDTLYYTFEAGAPSAANSSFTVTPDGPVVANDTEAYTATVILKDAQQNFVQGQQVYFDVPEGLRAVSAGPYVTDAQGTIFVAFVSAVEGTYPLTAWLASDFDDPANQIGTQWDLAFTTGPPSALQSTISATPSVAQADGTDVVLVTVELYDASGSKITNHDQNDPAQVVAISSTHGTVGPVTCADGVCTAEITSVDPGEATVSFTVAGAQSPSMANVEFVQVVEAPDVNPTDGKTLSGQGQPNTTITVTDPDGTVLCIVPVGEDGTFNCDLFPEAPDASELTVVATDEHGFESQPVEVVVDGLAPQAPIVDPSNGKEISGTGGEEGDTITVTDSDGNEITCSNAPVTVGADGTFSCDLSDLDPALEHGEIINVVVTDPAGNESEPGTVTVDTEPPAQPELEESNGTTIVGKTDEDSEGAEVTIVGPDGPIECANAPVLVQPDGSFNCDLTGVEPPLEDGDEIQVIITDESGNESTPETIIIDAVAPDQPELEDSNGTTIVGKTDEDSEGAEVTVNGPDGPIQCANAPVLVQPDGSFNCDLTGVEPPLEDGDEIEIIITDGAGNSTDPEIITIDKSKPEPPQVDGSNGSKVTGTAEPGSTVSVKDEDGNELCTVTASETDGTFSCTFDETIEDGSTIFVDATDKAGNTSDPTPVVVDSETLMAPDVDPSNGSTITGKAEPNSTVEVKNSSGTVICTTTAGADGSFSCPFTPALEHGTTVSVGSRDDEGNKSPDTSVTIDSVAPEQPELEESDGSTIGGKTDEDSEGSEVTVIGPDGPIECANAPVLVQPDGSFNCDLTGVEPPLEDGDEIEIIITDEAGNESTPEVIVIDKTAPAPPEVDPTNGSKVTGEAEPGSTVEVTDKDGNVLCTTTADATTGEFSCVPSPRPGDGETITITATDPAGNESEPTEVVVDAVPPTAPSVDPSDGNKVTGETEPGSSVEITDEDGNVLCTTTADDDGKFECELDPAPDHGDKIIIESTDESGNTSPPTTIVTDSKPPVAPEVDPTDGSKVEGKGEPGTTITVTDKDGNVICETQAHAVTGEFSCELDPALEDGDVITIESTDEAGNVSPPVKETVDGKAPTPPIVDPTDGSKITGEAEPGSKVTVTDKDGNVICETTAHQSTGAFECILSPELKEGSEITVTATDPAGNTSEETVIVVESKQPTAPLVDPSDGTTVSGTAEPGSVIEVRDESGAVVCTTTAHAVTGEFTCVLDSPAKPGDYLYVYAINKSGKVSEPTVIMVQDTPVVPPPGGGGGGKPGGGLPTTGEAIGLLTLAAAGLAAGGAGFVAIRRRKNDQASTNLS